VQVGSYNERAQADALRARLASAGHEAYVAEGEAGGVMRFRVRIGAFPTAEEARQAAARLASEAHVATYVTTR
jgi:cell division protein FtsN